MAYWNLPSDQWYRCCLGEASASAIFKSSSNIKRKGYKKQIKKKKGYNVKHSLD